MGRAWAAGGDDAARGLHLSWVRGADAASCVGAAQIEADVRRRLGGLAFDGVDASVEAVVVHTVAGWQASLAIRRTDGTLLAQREVQSTADSCESLAKASALSIALMLRAAHPDGFRAAPESSSTDDAANLSAPEAEEQAPAPQKPAPSAAPDRAALSPAARAGLRSGVGVVAGVACGVGLLPGEACGGVLRNEITLTEPFAATFGVHFLPEQAVARAGSSVGFGLTFAELGACHRLEISEPLVISTCAALAVGVLHVSVESPTPVAMGERLWWAANSGLRLSWSGGALHLQGGVEAFLPLDRHEYRVERADGSSARVYVDPPLGAMATLGAGVWF